MQKIILRLTDGTRVMGFALENSYDIVALYAPMEITPIEDGESNKAYYLFMPFDPLSDSAMVVFETQHVVTATIPKEIIVEYFDTAWPKYYPDFEVYKKKMLAEFYGSKKNNTEDVTSFSDEKLNEIFSDFLHKFNVDKKKLN